jgi:hypothetical protein
MPGMVALAGMAPPGLMVTLGRQRVIQVRTARSVAVAVMVETVASVGLSLVRVVTAGQRVTPVRLIMAVLVPTV